METVAAAGKAGGGGYVRGKGRGTGCIRRAMGRYPALATPVLPQTFTENAKNIRDISRNNVMGQSVEIDVNNKVNGGDDGGGVGAGRTHPLRALIV